MKKLIEIVKKYDFDKINTPDGVLYVIHENCVDDLEKDYSEQFAPGSIKKLPEWISIKTPPRESKECLVLYKKPMYGKQIKNAYYNHNLGLFTGLGCNITHWMELPPEPIE